MTERAAPELLFTYILIDTLLLNAEAREKREYIESYFSVSCSKMQRLLYSHASWFKDEKI